MNLTDYSILTLFYLSFKTITEEIKKEEEEEKQNYFSKIVKYIKRLKDN